MPSLNLSPVTDLVKSRMKEWQITPSSPLLAGVSGGVDSMVLLHTLKMLGYQVTAAHVNYHLRGEESNKDERLVRDWCEQQDIPVLVKDVEPEAYETSGMSIQMIARNIRYQWWDSLLNEGPYAFLVTAHHHDDNIETLLMHLLRGSGLKGLKGIPAKRDRIIRPLLSCRKQSLAEHANAFQIPFRNDSSNDRDDYLRNRIRHHLIPAINSLFPETSDPLGASLKRLQLEWVSWNDAYEQWKTNNISEQYGRQTVHANPEEYAFVLRWLEQQGFPYSLAADFVQAIPLQSGQSLSYKDHMLYRTHGGFELHPSSEEFPLEITNVGFYKAKGYDFFMEEVEKEAVIMDAYPYTEFVDANLVQWPLMIRKWEPGDTFQPIGMNGKSKKVQDLLVDAGIQLADKSHIRVLLSEHKIVWVLGLRLDHRFRIQPDTSRYFKLSYRPG